MDGTDGGHALSPVRCRVPHLHPGRTMDRRRRATRPAPDSTDGGLPLLARGTSGGRRAVGLPRRLAGRARDDRRRRGARPPRSDAHGRGNRSAAARVAVAHGKDSHALWVRGDLPRGPHVPRRRLERFGLLIRDRSTLRFRRYPPSSPGNSRHPGSSRKRSSFTRNRNASLPRAPFPMSSWRSTWLPSPPFESFRWNARTRASPTVRSTVRMSASYPSRARKSYPAAKVWHVSMHTAIRSGYDDPFTISASCSNECPTTVPCPAVFSRVRKTSGASAASRHQSSPWAIVRIAYGSPFSRWAPRWGVTSRPARAL